MPIRFRVAAISTLATLVLLLGAGALFVTTLRSGLQNSVDNSLRTKVDELSSEITAGGLLTRARGAGVRLADNSYAQVLTGDGTLLHSTSAPAGGPLLSRTQAASAARGLRFFDVSLPEAGSPAHRQQVRVLAEPVGAQGLVAAVGISRDVVNEAVERASQQLLVLGTGVLVVVAAGSWYLTRAALRPVERMRAQAARLQAQDADAGLSVPGSGDEIHRLALTFNALLARLHTALQREKEFVADAGHELRTPLTVLRGELELAQRPGRSAEELREAIAVAAGETDRLIRLAEDLLVLARNDDPSSVRWIDFDLAELVRDAVARVEPLALTRDVRIETVRPDAGLGTAHGDPERLGRALDNVLNNAVRFAPPATGVRVEVGRDERGNRIAVRDAGPGFPEALLPVVFERFRRADQARMRADPDQGYAGSGLGLAIVHSALSSHGGRVSVHNRSDGAGAEVTLSWPEHDPSEGG